jgi:protein-disulfide isomerase
MSSTGQGRQTRKEQREQARAERKSLEAQQAQSHARRRRLMQVGGIAVVAVAVIAIAVAVGTSGSSNKTPHTEGEKTKARSEVTALVGGVPQSGNVLGHPNAPVTLEYFGDLECPICKDFTLGAFPSIVQKYVREGKVKVVYRSMKTATREPNVFQEQQTAALAAGRQNLGWNYIELVYHNQGEEGTGYVTPAWLKERAQEVPGLNVAKWEEERHDPKLTEQVEKDIEASAENGFQGTPSFVLVKAGKPPKKLQTFSNQQLVDASALFEPEIEKMLKA